MRFLRLPAIAGLVVFASVHVFLVRPTNAQTPQERLRQLETATSIDREGIKPWHLRAHFNLYDLIGRKTESGVIEEWWASPTSHRLMVTSPSFDGIDPLGQDAPEKTLRETFLIRQLLSQIVHPVANFTDAPSLKVGQEDRTFSKVQLSCLEVKSTMPGPTYCVEPGKDILRINFDENESMSAVRNRLGHFQGVSMALDNAISFNGTKAIDGSVDVLEGFDTAKPPQALLSPVEEAAVLPDLVVHGLRTSFVQPNYPAYAKQQHIAGTVVLCVIISKQGTIRYMGVVATPHPSLSESAMQAVKQWKYEPMLIHGEPVEVSTAITVHYNLAGPGGY